jgi:hypothetical protein
MLKSLVPRQILKFAIGEQIANLEDQARESQALDGQKTDKENPERTPFKRGVLDQPGQDQEGQDASGGHEDDKSRSVEQGACGDHQRIGDEQETSWWPGSGDEPRNAEQIDQSPEDCWHDSILALQDPALEREANQEPGQEHRELSR